jgi:hypothetical protein
MNHSDLFYIASCFTFIGLVFLVGMFFGRSKTRAPQQTVIVFEATPPKEQSEKSAGEPEPDWFYWCFDGQLVVPLKSHVYVEKLAIISGFLRSAERFRRAEA